MPFISPVSIRVHCPGPLPQGSMPRPTFEHAYSSLPKVPSYSPAPHPSISRARLLFQCPHLRLPITALAVLTFCLLHADSQVLPHVSAWSCLTCPFQDCDKSLKTTSRLSGLCAAPFPCPPSQRPSRALPVHLFSKGSSGVNCMRELFCAGRVFCTLKSHRVKSQLAILCKKQALNYVLLRGRLQCGQF